MCMHVYIISIGQTVTSYCPSNARPIARVQEVSAYYYNNLYVVDVYSVILCVVHRDQLMTTTLLWTKEMKHGDLGGR